MNTLTQCTVTRAPERANGDGVRGVHTRVRALHSGDTSRMMRDAAAFTFGDIARDDVLARALRKSRTTVNRMHNWATTPLADAADALYLLERAGLHTDLVLEVLLAAAQFGADEHGRRIAQRVQIRRAS